MPLVIRNILMQVEICIVEEESNTLDQPKAQHELHNAVHKGLWVNVTNPQIVCERPLNS